VGFLKDEGVAEASAGLDGLGGVFGVAAEFGAERFNVGIDGAVHRGARVVPGLLKKLLAGEDAAGLAEENGEEFVFVRGEVERVTTAGDVHGVGLVMKEGRVGWRGLLATAEDGADAGHDGAGREGLSDVVVGTEFESEDVIDFGIACGQEEDGDPREVPDLAAKVEPREVGEADVEDGEVRSVGAEVIDTRLCGGDMSDGKVFRFKGVNQGVRDGGFVFDNQDGGHKGVE